MTSLSPEPSRPAPNPADSYDAPIPQLDQSVDSAPRPSQSSRRSDWSSATVIQQRRPWPRNPNTQQLTEFHRALRRVHRLPSAEAQRALRTTMDNLVKYAFDPEDQWSERGAWARGETAHGYHSYRDIVGTSAATHSSDAFHPGVQTVFEKLIVSMGLPGSLEDRVRDAQLLLEQATLDRTTGRKHPSFELADVLSREITPAFGQALSADSCIPAWRGRYADGSRAVSEVEQTQFIADTEKALSDLSRIVSGLTGSDYALEPVALPSSWRRLLMFV